VTRSSSGHDVVLNPRLNPYRHRAAELLSDDGVVGWVYVEPVHVAARLGGRLWWTRWGPLTEHVELWATADGDELNDLWIMDDQVDDLVDHWDRGRFVYAGWVYGLRWLDDTRSSEQRRVIYPDRERA
jgi:hypothetical protein